MANIVNATNSIAFEQKLCGLLMADMMEERELIEKRKKEMLIARFEAKKKKMDALQNNIRKESDAVGLSAEDKKRYAAHVTMEMPTWTYFQIMMGTKDQDFWSDAANRRKFLQDNPEYATKNF